MRKKYVIFDDFYPVIFGGYFQHSDVHVMGRTPTSAGFCSISETDAPPEAVCVRMLGVSCYGESVSLGLKSLPTDEAVIEKALNSD